MSVTLSVLEAWKRGLRSYPRTWPINQFSLPNSFQPPPRAASKYILGGIFWWFICLGRFCFIKMISHVSPQSTFRVQHAAHGKAIIKEKKVMLDPWLHFVPQNLLKSYLSCSKSLEGLPVESRQECAQVTDPSRQHARYLWGPAQWAWGLWGFPFPILVNCMFFVDCAHVTNSSQCNGELQSTNVLPSLCNFYHSGFCTGLNIGIVDYFSKYKSHEENMTLWFCHYPIFCCPYHVLSIFDLSIFALVLCFVLSLSLWTGWQLLFSSWNSWNFLPVHS